MKFHDSSSRSGCVQIKQKNPIHTTILFFLYILILLKITVFRSGISLQTMFINGTLNLLPFTEYIALLKLHQWWLFTYLFIGNIIWFVPFGCLFPFIRKKSSFGQTILCGFLLSLLIETAQYILGTGISELDDLILNVFGACIGYVIFRLWITKYKK